VVDNQALKRKPWSRIDHLQRIGGGKASTWPRQVVESLAF